MIIITTFRFFTTLRLFIIINHRRFRHRNRTTIMHINSIMLIKTRLQSFMKSMTVSISMLTFMMKFSTVFMSHQLINNTKFSTASTARISMSNISSIMIRIQLSMLIFMMKLLTIRISIPSFMKTKSSAILKMTSSAVRISNNSIFRQRSIKPFS